MEYTEEEKGRCRSCGFLSKHSTYRRSPVPRFYEIEKHERETTEHDVLFRYPADLASRVLEIPTELVCFVHAADLGAPLRHMNALTAENWPERLRIGQEIINRDRQCPAWYPYDPGCSPREHPEELQRQRLEDDRRTFEMKLFDLGQKAQENSLKVAEDSKAIVNDLKEIARANDKFSRRVTFLVVLLAVVQVVVPCSRCPVCRGFKGSGITSLANVS